VNGVQNTWHTFTPDQFQPGVTSQADVLEQLGPPSQVIALGERSVFYYLSQRQSGRALVFVVWNQANDQTRYDRAVFFFDASGVLTEFAIRDEAATGN